LIFSGRLATEFTSLGGFIVRTLATLARLKPICQADRSSALALKADKLLIADGLVRFEYRGRAAGSVTVAVGLVATPVVFAALVSNVETTVTVAARALARGALPRWAKGARQLG
jgi:uncharacterized membrane protein